MNLTISFVCLQMPKCDEGMQNMIGIFGITFDRLNIVYYNKGLCLYEKKNSFQTHQSVGLFFFMSLM